MKPLRVFCLFEFALLLFSGLPLLAQDESKVIHLLSGNDLGPFYSFLTNSGPGQDPDHVFTLTNGVLRVSGQHYGYLATRQTSFANYKLIAEFRWGEQTWAPRQTNSRDSGILVHFAGKDGEGAAHLWACAAVVGASLCWSFGAVLSQKLEFPPDAVLRAGMQMACGGVMLGAASLIHGDPIDLAAFSGRSLGALAYLIVFGSVLAFACYSYLLKHVRAEAVATHVFVNPLVAVALGAWLAGEQLRPAHLLSGLFILVSVCVIIFSRSE